MRRCPEGTVMTGADCVRGRPVCPAEELGGSEAGSDAGEDHAPWHDMSDLGSISELSAPSSSGLRNRIHPGSSDSRGG